jgi:hypothetical protein
MKLEPEDRPVLIFLIVVIVLPIFLVFGCEPKHSAEWWEDHDTVNPR